jgi:hypothetical protein
MIKKSIYLVICIYLSFLPKITLGQLSLSTTSIQSNPIFKSTLKTILFDEVNSDTLLFSTESENQFYGKRFGNGLLVATKLSNLAEDSVRIYTLTLSFYGGRTDEKVELSSARIKAMIWNENETAQTLRPSNSTRSSATTDIVVTAEEIRPVQFSFSDTSIIIPKNLWIGVSYESSVDTVHAISPIFNEAPNSLEMLFYRTTVVDSIRTDTMRHNHSQFWETPETVGGLSGYVVYKMESKSAAVITSLDEHEETKKPNDLFLFAYPNPFNPQTTIQILAKETGSARIEIYSIKGQRLVQKSLFLERNSPYQFQWDAHAFSSGIYFAKLIQNNSVKTVKLTLLK